MPRCTVLAAWHADCVATLHADCVATLHADCVATLHADCVATLRGSAGVATCCTRCLRRVVLHALVWVVEVGLEARHLVVHEVAAHIPVVLVEWPNAIDTNAVNVEYVSCLPPASCALAAPGCKWFARISVFGKQ